MKRTVIIAAALMMLAAVPAFSQNVQLHYDFGSLIYKGGAKDLSTRPLLTTTVEMFRPDDFGSTFFFIDMNYGAGGLNPHGGVVGSYWEIARELKFWDAPVSWHLEYNGGMDIIPSGVIYDDAWLTGVTYSFGSKDFSKTFSISAMYKFIPANPSPHNFQVTGVWNVWFCKRAFLFSGFIDFWREKRSWQNTQFILLSEPQIWYNFNTIKGMEKFNLSIGGEVEISNNFVGKGFYAIPTAAVKWTF